MRVCSLLSLSPCLASGQWPPWPAVSSDSAAWRSVQCAGMCVWDDGTGEGDLAARVGTLTSWGFWIGATYYLYGGIDRTSPLLHSLISKAS